MLSCLLSFCVQPAMKAREIADGGIKALKSGKYRNVRLNFANPDMVGNRMPKCLRSTIVPFCNSFYLHVFFKY